MKNDNKTTNRFFKLDSRIKESGISVSDAFVYAIIASCKNGESGEAYISIEKIMEMTGYGESVVSGSIKNLSSNNILYVTRKNLSRCKTMNVYTFPDYPAGYVKMSYEFLGMEMDRELKAFLIKLQPMLETRTEGSIAIISTSIESLSVKFGYTPRTLYNKMALLERCGYIGISREERKRWRNIGTNFVIEVKLDSIHQEMLKDKENKSDNKPNVKKETNSDMEERLKKIEDCLRKEIDKNKKRDKKILSLEEENLYLKSYILQHLKE